MFRYVLSLTFAVGLASAATIITIATCDGVTTTGTTGASCDDGRSSAIAGVGTNVFGFGVSAQADAGGFNPPPSQSAFASATFIDQYVFTVFGGTGGGFFSPCFNISGSGQGQFVQANDFGGSPPFIGCIDHTAFTFGVSQIFSLDMVASITLPGPPPQQQGQVSVTFLQAFSFLDSAGNPLSNITFTLVEVAEPAEWSLLSIGLIFLAVAIRGVRLRMYH
jgi:hypothetical protein